jgi:N-acyl-D-aspartate/D-glutamate deacylase
MEEAQVESELVSLECFPLNPTYPKTLNVLSKKTIVEKGGREVTWVEPHSERVDFVAILNKFSEMCALVVRASAVLLAMPVTACAAERNWSKR